jgi:hypothetical protein
MDLPPRLDDVVALEETLRRHIAAVDRRVAAGGNRYPEERRHVRVAARRVQELREELRLGRFIRSLTPPTAKPQFLLLFEHPDRGQTVLKAYGRARGGEGAALQHWRSSGVDAVPVLEYSDTPTTWLLMLPVDGKPMPAVDGPALHEYTKQLAATMSTAHNTCGHHQTAAAARVSLPPARFRDLAPEICRHLSVVLHVLQDRGYETPRDWRRRAEELYSTGPVTLLHGDLGPANLMVGESDAITILDPSAYIGSAAFDAARWCARVGGPAQATQLLQEWMRLENLPDGNLALRMLGLELLMEAGVREILKAERGEPTVPRLDAMTLRYLAASRELAR